MENIMHIQNIVPIQSTASVQGGAQAASPLASMQPGDTLSAQVQDVQGTSVTLTLPDGSQLVASSEAGQSMRPMDTIQLQMQAAQGGAARLRLVAINNQPVSANVSMTELALMNMRLPSSRVNLMAANLFSRLELPESPAAFARFAQLVQGETALNPTQAALFAASDIPLTQENIQAFAQFLHSPAQADGFAAAVKEALAQPGGGGQAAAVPAAAEGAALAAPGPAQAQAPAAPAAPATTSEAAPPGAQNLLAAVEAAQSALQSADTQAPQAAQPQANAPLAQAVPAQEAPTAQTAQAQPAPAAPQGEANAAAPAQALPQSAAPQTAQPQPDAPIPFQAQSVGEALRSIFPKLSEGEGEALGKALQRAVPELASRLSSLTEAARGAAGPAAKEAAQLGAQVVQQLQFGSEMHSLYYTQIPFRHQEREQSAELYVLKRRGSGSKIDEGNATIALCLETNHMGRVESLLQVRQQELSFNFRVETPQVRDFMRTQLEAVARLPFPAQYRYAGSTVCLQEAPLTPMNAAKTLRDTFGVHDGGLDISV